MALQSFRCPNCNGQLQMDDNLEKGYCMYCGSTIHVQEEVAKIKVEHSGKVEIDDSKKFANSMALADRAFEIGNYGESYGYYCTALECQVNNAHAVFRKGLCAAYISATRVGELEQGVKTALEINRTEAEDADRENHMIFTELFAYIKATYKLDCERPKGFVYPSLAAANNTFSVITVLTRLCGMCADIISEEMMAAHPTYESEKRACLEMGLELCKRGTGTLKYISGTQRVKRGNVYVTENVYNYAKSPAAEMERQYLTQFKTAFNNLPTTRSTLAEYDGEIAKLEKDVQAYKLGLESYFRANPEIGKVYNQTPLPFVLATAAAFFLIILVAAVAADSVPKAVFVILMIVLVLSGVGCGVIFVMRLVACSRNRKQILSQLPPDLASLKVTHDRSSEQLAKLRRTKADFVRKNIKK